jgi:P-type Ca2+ transporter type 2C
LFFDENISGIFQKLNTSERGLTTEEANKRIKQFGYNEIQRKKKNGPIKIFLRQFENFLIVLLIFAAVLSFFLGEHLEFYGIMAIILLSATLGFIQEYRAENAMEALLKIAAPNAKVFRNGQITNIPAREIVVGDIVLLEEGDIVPADLRLFEVSGMQVDESSLTGESLPSKKNQEDLGSGIPITDQKNMAFMGCMVVYGEGKGVVANTGMRTEFGKIADTIQSIQDTETPLQKKFGKMAQQIGIAVMSLVALVFLFGVFSLKMDFVKLFIFSLSLAVAAVPSALPAIVTVSLGLGAKRLAKKNMIIKQLPAAESLGAVTMICTDKTGTLTQNQMTIIKMYMNGNIVDVSGVGYSPYGNFTTDDNGHPKAVRLDNYSMLFKTGFFCNDAQLEHKKDTDTWSIIGDSTEGSLLVLAKKAEMDSDDLRKKYSKVKEFPFDSNRKLMSVVYKNAMSKKNEAFVKGAPDVIIKLCTKILVNGKIKTLTPKEKSKILSINNGFADDALRVLGLAYKDASKIKDYEVSNVEKDLVFLGLVGMMDPPREGVRQAIEHCREAGIGVIMITGDHPKTAMAVARNISLFKDGDKVLTGIELDQMSDEELEGNIANIRIIARALPIQKTRIVDVLQKKGHIVAMTGDGVNDAPALKKADIGIAMGISGTDVSKEVAKAILVDDHFTTIVNGIVEGRNIYDKIIKSTKYLLACNSGEIFSVMFSIILNLPLPMIPLQILLMNLLTDGVPAMGLGSENEEDDIMKRAPRNPKDNPITPKMLMLILFFGLAMGAGTLFVFSQYADGDLSYAQTMAFTTLVMFEMFAVMSARSFSSFKKMNPLSNKPLALGILTSIAIQLLVIYWSPLQKIFGTTAIGLSDWIFLLVVSSMGFILMESSKIFIREEYNGVKKPAKQ